MRKSLPKFLAAAVLAWPAWSHAQEGSIFDQLDANKDGVVATDEVTGEKARLFERMLRLGDKNGDGKLSREEFSAAVKPQEGQRTERPAGSPEGRPDPQRIFATLDKDGDGKVSREEAQGPLKENFERIDANKDGQIDGTELKQALEQMQGRRPGGEGGPNRAEATFATLDANKDGKLTADEVPAEHKEKFEKMRTELRVGTDGAVTREQFLRFAAAMAGREGEPRRDGDQPRREGDAPRREGDAPRREGDAPRREGDQPRREGDRPSEGRRPDAPPEGARGGFPFPLGPLMAAIDANHDGELSAEEIANASANIGKLDKDGDGKVTRNELMPARPEGAPAGPPNPDEFIKRLMQGDKNKDGKLSAEEVPDFLRRGFERLDANSDGQLDETEMKQIINRMREGFGRPGATPDRPREGTPERRPEGDRPREGQPRPEGERRPDAPRGEGERRPETRRDGERKEGERRDADRKEGERKEGERKDGERKDG